MSFRASVQGDARSEFWSTCVETAVDALYLRFDALGVWHREAGDRDEYTQEGWLALARRSEGWIDWALDQSDPTVFLAMHVYYRLCRVACRKYGAGRYGHRRRVRTGVTLPDRPEPAGRDTFAAVDYRLTVAGLTGQARRYARHKQKGRSDRWLLRRGWKRSAIRKCRIEVRRVFNHK